jgi:hypothetical protein
MIINKTIIESKPVKIDGMLTVGRNKTYTLHSKLILTSGSKIELRKGSTLIISSKGMVRNENNEPVDINKFITKHSSAKVIVK